MLLLASCGVVDDRPASGDPDLRSGLEKNERLSASTETVNINTARFDELQRIPHVGATMAEKIIEHREKHGPFKRPEEIMLIQGISDARFRRIRNLIRVE